MLVSTDRFLLLLVLVMCAAHSCHCAPFVATKSPKIIHLSTTVLDVATEQEIFEGGHWHHKSWLNHNNHHHAADDESESTPLPQPADDGHWKIVTSHSNRDALGWDYQWSPGQAAVRRRTWLRIQGGSQFTVKRTLDKYVLGR